MEDPRDFTERYNTSLTPWEEDNFQKFLNEASKKRGYNLGKDLYNYDLRGWWKNNADNGLPLGHFVDTYKKPNHPTFSNESQYHGQDGYVGGRWVQSGRGQYMYLPSETNLKHYPIQQLQEYFKQGDPNSILFVPPTK